MTKRSRYATVLVWALLVLCACAPLFPHYAEPVVTLTGFRVLPGDSIVPTFEIDLHVSNPNRIPLKLQGMTYSLTIEGERVLYGIAGELPQITAYGEEEIRLQVRPDLFSTLSLFNRLRNQPRDTFSYKLEAQLDAGGFLPHLRVTRDGVINL